MERCCCLSNLGSMHYAEAAFEADLRFESLYVQRACACVAMALARQSLDASAGLSPDAAKRAHVLT